MQYEGGRPSDENHLFIQGLCIHCFVFHTLIAGIFTDIPGENGTQVVSSDSAMDRAVPCTEEDITGALHLEYIMHLT